MSPEDFKSLAKAQKAVVDAHDVLAPQIQAFRQAVKEFVWKKHPELKDTDLVVNYDVCSTSSKGVVLDVDMKIWVFYKIPSQFGSFREDFNELSEARLTFTPEEVFGWGLADLEKIGLKYK